MRIKVSSPVCEHCGFEEGTRNAPHQLQIGTVLREQYRIGRVLGQGGFGITYLGWDLYLDTAVAIKEYYPSGAVMRDAAVSTTVSDVSGNGERFRANRERFLREAKVLARFSQVPEVVQVRNFFLDNNTAYIVMEYVEGITLKQYVKNSGGRISAPETLRILKPVIRTLARVHEAGIVHRDISPDNIMMVPGGKAKVLDFGAGRDVSGAAVNKELTKSTEAILKQGYAPIEQYQKRGALGPWTDVYALCATIYYCLTGEVPPDSPARMMGYENISFDALGLSEAQQAALDHGMALRTEERTASMEQLYRELYGETSVPVPVQPAPVSRKKKPFFAIAAVAAAAVAIGGAALLIPREEPAPAQTEATTLAAPLAEIASGVCGESLRWTLREDGHLMITGTGIMDDYTDGLPRPWEDHLADIRELTLEEGVGSIGAEAFRGTGLTQVCFPQSLTRVGDKAFYDCPELSRVELTQNTVLRYSIREEPIFTRKGNEVFGITLAGLSGGVAEDYADVFGYGFESTGKVDYEARGSCTTAPYSGGDVNWFYDRDTKYLRFIGKDWMHQDPAEFWDELPRYGASNAPWAKFAGEVENVYIGDGVRNIGHNAFENFSLLNNIYIAESVKQIGAHALRSTGLEQFRAPRGCSLLLFSVAGCENLREVIIPLGYPNLSKGTFAGCVNLESLYVHYYEFPVTGALGMSENFAFWLPFPDPLSDPEFPGNLTVYTPEVSAYDLEIAEKYGFSMETGFEGHRPQRTGTIGGWAAWMLEDGVLTLAGSFNTMFYRSPGNLDALAWNGEARYGNNRTAEEAPWYEWRDEIHTVIVKPGIFTLNRGLFCDMPNLKYMDLGTVENLYTGTIDNCGIETLILPESLCTIEKGAVVNCKQLKSLVIEDGSGGIGRGAFAGNDALEDIWFPSGAEVFAGDIFADAPPVNVTFHVKEGSWAQRYAQEKGFSIAIE